MDKNIGFDRAKEERNNLSFCKIFQTADLSSESMTMLLEKMSLLLSLTKETCANIYEQSGTGIVMPRNPYGEIKKEQGESSFKDVKKEDKTSESMVGVEVKGSNKESKASKKIKKVEKVVPEFTITLNKTHFRFLAIPNCFTEDHIKRESKMFKIRHSDENRSWDVLLLARGTKPIFPGGWAKVAKEYPLSVGDMCTFKLVKPSEFVLVVSKKASD
ncbi:unnamed protein product [Cochlearia groenlandica]